MFDAFVLVNSKSNCSCKSVKWQCKAVSFAKTNLTVVL